ncbi:MAG: hypothetical protein HFI33_10820 [Lachnospiraceae bacterium]|nr:hypothetical protein [Lachnospiraceae bacterium]
MRKRSFLLVVLALPILAAGLLLTYVFVFSIRSVKIWNETDEDGRCTFIRYEEDMQQRLLAEVVADNELASRELNYSSDRPDLVEVSEEGILTIKNPGDALITVTAKANPWVKAELPVTVLQKAVRMEIRMPEELPANEYYYLLHTGDAPAMVPLPYPSNAMVENLTFESGAPEIVTVTEEGVLEAHKAGIAIIQVYWEGPYTEPGKTEDLGRFLVNVCRREDHDKLANHQLEWYEKSCLIAHALGNAGEYTYTNTKEALEESIAQGYKNLEVDLSLTTDGQVVCRHTWYSDDFAVSYDGEIPDLATFEREKYFGTLTPLSGRELLEIWAEHPELYFITDVKQDENTNLVEVMEKLVALAKETGHEELLDHLIVQAYTPEDYDRVNAIYPIKHWLFTTYQILDTPGGDVTAASFAREKDMQVLTVPASCMGTDHFINLADEYGLTLFTHTLNNGADVWRLSKRGIYGYYSDFIIPNDPYENGEK